jgi:SAM-dependent methyltransferase
MSTGPAPSEKRERLARLYDSEILPAYAARFASMLLRLVEIRPAARVLEIGCATGHLTAELARRFDHDSRVTALDESDAFLAEARARVEADAAVRALVLLHPATVGGLPVDDASANVVVSNLAVATGPDPRRAVRELVRALAPGGEVVITAPLRGTWAEFLDLFRDVLHDGARSDSLAALDRYVGGLPTGETVAGWLEAAGLTQVQLEVERWEILFKSAREFFFAPLIELGPLSRWKQLAGRGDEMQDAFFFTKEAIDTYFKGRAFAVTVVGAAVRARKKPAP